MTRRTKNATTALMLPAMIEVFELEDLWEEVADAEDGTVDKECVDVDVDKECADVDVDKDCANANVDKDCVDVNVDKDVDVDDDCADGDMTARSGL
jgi:hypothetical protein